MIRGRSSFGVYDVSKSLSVFVFSVTVTEDFLVLLDSIDGLVEPSVVFLRVFSFPQNTKMTSQITKLHSFGEALSSNIGYPNYMVLLNYTKERIKMMNINSDQYSPNAEVSWK